MVYAYAREIRLNGEIYVERYRGREMPVDQDDIYTRSITRHSYRLTGDGHTVGELQYDEVCTSMLQRSRIHVRRSMPVGWSEPGWMPDDRDRVKWCSEEQADVVVPTPVARDLALLLVTTNDGQVVWLDFRPDFRVKPDTWQTQAGVWGVFRLPGGPVASGKAGAVRALISQRFGLAEAEADAGVPIVRLYDSRRGCDVQVFRLAGDYLEQLLLAAKTPLDGMWTLLTHARGGQWVSAGGLKALHHRGGLAPLTRRVFETQPACWPGWEQNPDDVTELQEAS